MQKIIVNDKITIILTFHENKNIKTKEYYCNNLLNNLNSDFAYTKYDSDGILDYKIKYKLEKP